MLRTFRTPNDPKLIWAFRIVGLPDEEVEIDNEELLVDGVRVDLPAKLSLPGYLPGEVVSQATRTSWRFKTYRVPPGAYFLLGDNTRFSNDSRFIGSIPATSIVGRVDF